MKKLILFLFLTLVAFVDHTFAQKQKPGYFSELDDIFQIRQFISATHPKPFKFKVVPGWSEKDPGNSGDSIKSKWDTIVYNSGNGKDTTIVRLDTILWYAPGVDIDRSDSAGFEGIVDSIMLALSPGKNDPLKGASKPDNPPAQGPRQQPGAGGVRAFSPIRFISYATLMSMTEGDPPPTARQTIRNELLNILLITDGGSPDNVQNNVLRFAHSIPAFQHLQDIKTAQTQLSQIGAKGINLTQQSSNPASLFAGTAGINQTAIIEGIVDWIINSAKQELLASIFDKWYNTLYNDPIAGKLLANTLKTYQQFEKTNSTNLAKFGALWKASFQQDLANIPVNLEDESFVQTVIRRIAPTWPGERELTPVISGGTTIVYGMYQKKHIVNLLSELNTEYVTSAATWHDRLPIFKRAVIFSNVITSVIGQMNGTAYDIVSVNVLKNYDDVHWATLMRDIYLKNKNELTLVMGKDPIAVLNEVRNGPGAKFYNIISAAIAAYTSIQSSLSTELLSDNTESTAPAKTISGDDFGKILDLSLSALKKSVPYILSAAGQTNNPTFQYIVGDIDAISSSISQIGEGIAAQQYGKVLDGATQLLTYVDTVLQIRGLSTSRIATSITVITKFGSFMVNILSAQNPSDVSSALDELIPRDQYKLKNTSPWSVSLSAYPGFFVGHERVTSYALVNGKPDQSAPVQKWGTSASVYLPIGIDLTKGFGNSCVGVFLQAFDLGAVLNYRLTNNDSTVSTNPNISWQQLLSPGASLFWQLPHTPIVVGGGFNYTPALRKIQQEGTSYDANALRWGIYLAVDVTAIHLSLFKSPSK